MENFLNEWATVIKRLRTTALGKSRQAETTASKDNRELKPGQQSEYVKKKNKITQNQAQFMIKRWVSD